MPKIKDVIDELVASFGLRENISEKEYQAMLVDYNQRAYVKCVAKIRNLFKLSMVKIVIRYAENSEEIFNYMTNDGKKGMRKNIESLKQSLGEGYQKASMIPMGILIPPNIPIYGTPNFHRLQLRLLINRNIFKKSFDMFIVGVAHEMSHVLLDSTYNPWHESEKATDILVLIHGFMEVSERICANDGVDYLTPREVTGICKYLREKQQER